MLTSPSPGILSAGTYFFKTHCIHGIDTTTTLTPEYMADTHAHIPVSVLKRRGKNEKKINAHGLLSTAAPALLLPVPALLESVDEDVFMSGVGEAKGMK